MNPALHAVIANRRHSLQLNREIAAILPADDAELDRWIEEAVAELDATAFGFLTIAAIGEKRKVDARHLVRGAALVTEPKVLGCFAWHMEGDVPGHLLSAIRAGQLAPNLRATALFVSTVICLDRRGGAVPPELLAQGRILAREFAPKNARAADGNEKVAHACLFAMAYLLRDPAMTAILKVDMEAKRQNVENIVRTLKDDYAQMPADFLIPEPARTIGNSSAPVRRAVARIGRNDPCPCRSGRKYKACCMAKDQQRLQDSSHVAGLSRAELAREPEPHLTRERLWETAGHEVARFDPRKVPSELHEWFFFKLSASGFFERAVECLELLGFPDALDECCRPYLVMAAINGRKDAIDLLYQRHPRPEKVRESGSLGSALIHLQDEPAKMLEELEKRSLEALQSEDQEFLQDYATALLRTNLPATGIWLARAAMQALDQGHAKFVLDALLETRDRLGLSPDDPASEITERQFVEEVKARERHDASDEGRKLQEARLRLEGKAKEVEELKRAMSDLQRAMERREKERLTGAGLPAAPAVDPQAMEELRFKVQELKAVLKERQEERAALRRELREAHEKLESAPRVLPEPPEADPEAEHVLAEEAAAIQPVRLPEFPRRFEETLGELPQHVARSAVAMAGRLAAGEAAAFAGVVRLKACPDVYRQRIGGDHRLLFRLQPGRLIVVDLINRRDLEKRIRTLASGAV